MRITSIEIPCSLLLCTILCHLLLTVSCDIHGDSVSRVTREATEDHDNELAESRNDLSADKSGEDQSTTSTSAPEKSSPTDDSSAGESRAIEDASGGESRAMIDEPSAGESRAIEDSSAAGDSRAIATGEDGHDSTNDLGSGDVDMGDGDSRGLPPAMDQFVRKAVKTVAKGVLGGAMDVGSNVMSVMSPELAGAIKTITRLVKNGGGGVIDKLADGTQLDLRASNPLEGLMKMLGGGGSGGIGKGIMDMLGGMLKGKNIGGGKMKIGGGKRKGPSGDDSGGDDSGGDDSGGDDSGGDDSGGDDSSGGGDDDSGDDSGDSRSSLAGDLGESRSGLDSADVYDSEPDYDNEFYDRESQSYWIRRWLDENGKDLLTKRMPTTVTVPLSSLHVLNDKQLRKLINAARRHCSHNDMDYDDESFKTNRLANDQIYEGYDDPRSQLGQKSLGRWWPTRRPRTTKPPKTPRPKPTTKIMTVPPKTIKPASTRGPQTTRRPVTRVPPAKATPKTTPKTKRTTSTSRAPKKVIKKSAKKVESTLGVTANITTSKAPESGKKEDEN